MNKKINGKDHDTSNLERNSIPFIDSKKSYHNCHSQVYLTRITVGHARHLKYVSVSTPNFFGTFMIFDSVQDTLIVIDFPMNDEDCYIHKIQELGRVGRCQENGNDKVGAQNIDNVDILNHSTFGNHDFFDF
jgi:hypothetical protein